MKRLFALLLIAGSSYLLSSAESEAVIGCNGAWGPIFENN